MITTLRWAGAFLAAIGVVGLLTVADDFRHKWEMVEVGSILTAGLLTLSVSFFLSRKR